MTKITEQKAKISQKKYREKKGKSNTQKDCANGLKRVCTIRTVCILFSLCLSCYKKNVCAWKSLWEFQCWLLDFCRFFFSQRLLLFRWFVDLSRYIISMKFIWFIYSLSIGNVLNNLTSSMEVVCICIVIVVLSNLNKHFVELIGVLVEAFMFTCHFQPIDRDIATKFNLLKWFVSTIISYVIIDLLFYYEMVHTRLS